MRGWRSKLVVLLIVYFAGFATAIYMLVPVPQDSANQDNSLSYSMFKSDKFAQSFSVGMHRCVDYAKVAAKDLGEFIKEKYNEANKSSN
jgi:hypothetical protein